MVSFDVSAADRGNIVRIVDRAKALGLISKRYDRMTCTMDLTATHANGTPLDLGALAGADDFNVTHDVTGIARHIDRETGKLTSHFRPRFAAKAPSLIEGRA